MSTKKLQILGSFGSGSSTDEIIDIDHGGTGATTAFQALQNLGAFSRTGGTITGSITTSNGSAWTTFQNVRTVNDVQHDVAMYVSGAGDGEIVKSTAGTTMNKMSLKEDQTVFMKPVSVESGGTGASSKTGARNNLGIMSGTSLPSSGTEGDIFFLYS